MSGNFDLTSQAQSWTYGKCHSILIKDQTYSKEWDNLNLHFRKKAVFRETQNSELRTNKRKNKRVKLNLNPQKSLL